MSVSKLLSGLVLLAAAGGWFYLLVTRDDPKDDWPTAHGIVLSSTFPFLADPPSEFEVVYRYEVGGKTYEATQSWYTDRRPSGFKDGASVTVHFNPDRHSESVVKTHASGWLTVMQLLGVQLLFAAGIILIVSTDQASPPDSKVLRVQGDQ